MYSSKILKIHTAADAALQQDGGQVGDHINGEVKVHLHAIGMCKLQILHSLAKVPVLLVQPNLGKDSLRGISSFFYSAKKATRFKLSSEPPIKLPQYLLIYICLPLYSQVSCLMSQSKCSDHAGWIFPLSSFFQSSTISRIPSSSGTSFLISVSCRSRKARASLDAVKPVS